MRSELIEMQPARRLSAAAAFDHPFLTVAHEDLAHRHLEFAALAVRDPMLVKRLPIQVIDRLERSSPSQRKSRPRPHRCRDRGPSRARQRALCLARSCVGDRIDGPPEKRVRRRSSVRGIAVGSAVRHARPPRHHLSRRQVASAPQLRQLRHLSQLIRWLEMRQVELFERAYTVLFEALEVFHGFDYDDTGERGVTAHERKIQGWKAQLVKRMTDALGWPALGTDSTRHWSPTYLAGMERISRWLNAAARGTQEARHRDSRIAPALRLREGFKRRARRYPELEALSTRGTNRA